MFNDIPEDLRLKRPLKTPPGLAETDVVKRLRALAGRNADAERYNSFLGAGCYDHFSPAVLNHLILRGEFLAAYTPYQPEISQGTLKTLYEYQTLIWLLTGMEASNASMYEGASATAEAILMAHRVTGRPGVVLARALHPEYRQVAETYGGQVGLRFSEIPAGEAGTTDPALVPYYVSDQTACLVVTHGSGRLVIDFEKHTFVFIGKDFTASARYSLRARAEGGTDYVFFASGKTTPSGNLHIAGTWVTDAPPAEIALGSSTYDGAPLNSLRFENDG